MISPQPIHTDGVSVTRKNRLLTSVEKKGVRYEAATTKFRLPLRIDTSHSEYAAAVEAPMSTAFNVGSRKANAPPERRPNSRTKTAAVARLKAKVALAESPEPQARDRLE